MEWPVGAASASEAARGRVLSACACPHAPPPFGRGHRVLCSERQPARSTGAPTPWSPSPAIGFLGGVLAAARLRMACLSVTSWAWTLLIWSGWWCATAELSQKFLYPWSAVGAFGLPPVTSTLFRHSSRCRFSVFLLYTLAISWIFWRFSWTWVRRASL